MNEQRIDKNEQGIGKSVVIGVLVAVFAAIILGIGSFLLGIRTRVPFVPPKAVVAFDTDTCPAGWHPFGAADGRYIVGVQPAGHLGQGKGTPLGDLEDRPTGQHSHSVYVLAVGGEDDTNNGVVYGFPGHGGYRRNVQQEAKTFSTLVEGKDAPTGTNAPYVQLKYCEKEGLF